MMPMLVEAAIRSLGLAVIVSLCLALARVRTPHAQKTAWTAVLMAALLMPLLMRMPLQLALPASSPRLLLVLKSATRAAHPASWVWIGSLTTLYWLIALALMWRYGMGMKHMFRVRRSARVVHDEWTGDIDVRISSAIGAPLTFGSTVLFPEDFAGWGRGKLAAAIAHERSHVLERDCYVLWLARLHSCLFWFNPLAWWLQRTLADLAERTSDEAAAAALGDRPRYAEILLEFVNERTIRSMATSMATAGVAERIERLIGQATPPRAPKPWRRGLLVLALLPLVAATAVPLHADTPGLAQSDEMPRVTNPGGLAELSKYYPPQAMHQGVEGSVEISVTLDPQGRPTDTLILSEDPAGMGFGAAASSIVHTMQYANPTGHTVQFSLRVKFALSHDEQEPGSSAAASVSSSSG